MGESPPDPTDDDATALHAFALLANGMGGLDWAGLEVVVAHLGIDDVGALVDRLLVIKTWKRPEAPEGAAAHG